jgi:hypothetical protein
MNEPSLFVCRPPHERREKNKARRRFKGVRVEGEMINDKDAKCGEVEINQSLSTNRESCVLHFCSVEEWTGRRSS